MSESNGKPSAQSFSCVTDRCQFLEFTGTPSTWTTQTGVTPCHHVPGMQTERHHQNIITYSTIKKSELLPTNNMTCPQRVHRNAIMEWSTVSIALTICLLWFLSFNRQKGCSFSFLFQASLWKGHHHWHSLFAFVGIGAWCGCDKTTLCRETRWSHFDGSDSKACNFPCHYWVVDHIHWSHPLSPLIPSI
jgi:hypothetical protein